MSHHAQYPNQWTAENTAALFERIDKLTPSSPALWGKMNVSQMLTHCAFPYLQALGKNNQAPPAVMKWLVKTFYKKSMTNTVPYKQNLPTNPAFVVVDEKTFDLEKENLKKLIHEFQEKGSHHFEGKAQISLGKLSAEEWNNLMYKHIDHHLRQFGV